MCECFKDKKFLNELFSVVTMALLIVAMYLILSHITESFKDSIRGYLFILVIAVIVVGLLVFIMKKYLFKNEKLDGALKVFDLLDAFSNFLGVVLVYFGISTESWSNTETVFLIILCFKLFYVSLSIIEIFFSKENTKDEVFTVAK